MYRYQKRCKTVGILLIFTLLTLISMSVFPSPVFAQDEVWDCPDMSPGEPMLLDFLADLPQYCSGIINLPEVKALRLGVTPPLLIPIPITLIVILGPGPSDYVQLEWNGVFWESPGPHPIIVTPGPEYDIIEATFDPPIQMVNQVCLGLLPDMPNFVAVYELQLTYSPGPTEDFGDAPDPTYPTLLASDGARHQITGLFLGAGVDGEPDGQPDASATGDDLDINGDDEDGVTFTTSLIPGNTADVSVVASAAGLLDAWVDFNGNGDWSDAGEQIFTSEPLAVGANNLSFSVPAGAASGSTFARFRVSSSGGLSDDGFAADGEVEDYQVSISEAELGSISGMKFDDSNGNSAKDPGEGGIPVWAIQLKDGSGNLIAETLTGPGGEYSFGSLEPGTYQVHEALPLGWTQTVPGGAGYHGVTLSSGQNVQDVDFGNQYIAQPPLEVGGNVYPADRLTMLAPWILFAVAMIVGATIVVKRRRA